MIYGVLYFKLNLIFDIVPPTAFNFLSFLFFCRFDKLQRTCIAKEKCLTINFYWCKKKELNFLAQLFNFFFCQKCVFLEVNPTWIESAIVLQTFWYRNLFCCVMWWTNKSQTISKSTHQIGYCKSKSKSKRENGTK